MPTGKVKWFDTEKGFGFLATDEGDEVFVHASALPSGVETLKAGSRVEFGVADGKRGPQALSLRLLDVPASVVNFPEEMSDDPQVTAAGMMAELEHDLTGPQRVVGPVVRMSGTPTAARRPSPPLAGHTREVLREGGIPEGEIDALLAAGVITSRE